MKHLYKYRCSSGKTAAASCFVHLFKNEKDHFLADKMVFRFCVKLLMLTPTVQKQILFSPGVFIVLNSNPASCKEKNFSPQSSLPAFLAHLFNADSGLLQSGRCGIFVVKPIDYPNCFMTQAQLVINCSLWVGNHMFPDSHPQMHTPLAPRVDEGIQRDADSTHLSLRNH